ncbi:MAG TPA: FliM/FliN family flagellar motor switch protein, partial [Candidatus Sulfotelmatobacter sp.]|nr:FliM/FliN family flagellar motor switch protein [Candidatus Sulfotelmatobacter sp.]
DLAHSLINHALGSRDLGPVNQSLNETENGILLTALTEYLPKYVQSFDDIFADPALTIVGSPDIVPDPSITPSATFVYFKAEVSFNDNPAGKIAFGYLASHLKTLLKVHEEKGKIRPLNFSRLTTAILSTIKVPVLALLGKTNLLTSELDQLEAGDVVALDSAINSTVSLRIGDLLKIMAEPGIRNRKRTVKIAGLTEEQLPVAPPVEVAPPPLEKPAPPPAKEEQPAEVEPVEETEEEEFTEEELFPEEEEFPEEEIGTQGG